MSDRGHPSSPACRSPRPGRAAEHHGLRHSFATAALEARVPVEVVAARLGNTPRMVQEVCSHVIPADDKAAAQVVGDLFRQRGVTNR